MKSFFLVFILAFVLLSVPAFAVELGISSGAGIEVIEVVPDELDVDQLTVNAASVILAEDQEPSTFALDSPSGHWIEVSGAPVDYIYIPSNFIQDSFYIENGRLYSMSSSTITGYADGYSFRFAPYSTPQYRNDGQTYTWQDVNLIVIDAQGVEIEGFNHYFTTEFWLVMAALGVLLCYLFIKR